jgi:phosphoribosyl-dephospho-CoA transferase
VPQFTRNRLVWLDAAAWRDIAARAPDAQALALIERWQAMQWPVVVCSQPPGLQPGRLAVGLPAPQSGLRRRLALHTAMSGIQRHDTFPRLAGVARQHAWSKAAQALDGTLASAGATARVHGSHGWQALTGEVYVHAGSDLDLSIEVPHAAAARAAVIALEAARLPLRVDGELAFPDGSAVAWREYSQLLQGQVDQVLLKRLHGPQLAHAGRAPWPDAWQPLPPGSRPMAITT